MKEAIKKMEQGKAGRPSRVIAEMIKAGGREIVTAISELVNLIIYEKSQRAGRTPSLLTGIKENVMQQIVGTIGDLSS